MFDLVGQTYGQQPTVRLVTYKHAFTWPTLRPTERPAHSAFGAAWTSKVKANNICSAQESNQLWHTSLLLSMPSLHDGCLTAIFLVVK